MLRKNCSISFFLVVECAIFGLSRRKCNGSTKFVEGAHFPLDGLASQRSKQRTSKHHNAVQQFEKYQYANFHEITPIGHRAVKGESQRMTQNPENYRTERVLVVIFFLFLIS
jgi:hypothetical protein